MSINTKTCPSNLKRKDPAMEEIQALILKEARHRRASGSYQNMASAIHSVLMEIGREMVPHMTWK